MITFQEFKNLSPDEKNGEILRCLPLLIPLGDDIANLKVSMNEALEKITKLEYEFGVSCPKTRSVDDILESPQDSKAAQFNSVDNINKTSSINIRNRCRNWDGVSSFTQPPLPDISGP